MTFQEFSDLIAKNFPELKDYVSTGKTGSTIFFFLEDPKTTVRFIEFSDNNYTVIGSDLQQKGPTLIEKSIKDGESLPEFITRIIQEHLDNIKGAISKVTEFNIPAARATLRDLGFKAKTQDLVIWQVNVNEDTSISIETPWRFYYYFRVTIFRSYRAPVSETFDTFEEALKFLTD